MGLWALVVGGAESPENHAVYLAVMKNMDRVFPSSLFGSLLGQFDAINTDSSKIRQRIADLQHNLHVVRTTAPAVTPQSSFVFETNLQSRLQAVATERANRCTRRFSNSSDVEQEYSLSRVQSWTPSFESPKRRNTKEDAPASCRLTLVKIRNTSLSRDDLTIVGPRQKLSDIGNIRQKADLWSWNPFSKSKNRCPKRNRAVWRRNGWSGISGIPHGRVRFRYIK